MVVASAALLAGSALLRPGFYDSHDGLLNVHRLFELEKCLADGQIPCRWVPDMGAGYGYPLFNFYPPLPSAVAEGFRLLGASLLDAIKWAFLLGLVVGAFGMYRLAARFFGPAGAVLAAVLYVFAPYQAIDIFVRGALGEAWGMALLPLVFLTGHRCLTEPGRALRHALPCALCWAALLLTHDLVALMATPFYAAWLLVSWRMSRRSPVPAVLAHALALGLAAFFLLPLLFELRHVHADTLRELYSWARFENNFLSATQLLGAPTAWGYGALGTHNQMSLFIGRIHLLLGGGAVGLCVFAWLRERRVDASGTAALTLGVAALVAAFMILPASRFLWEAIPPLSFLQFPWRFLAITSFGLAFAAGWLVYWARDHGPVGLAIVAVATVAAIATSWSWFRPSAMHVVPDQVLANEWEIAKARHGLFDFLPRSVDLEHFLANPPASLPAPVHAPPTVDLTKLERTTNRIGFDARVRGDEMAQVRINVFDFPGWTLEVDGRFEDFTASDDRLGRLHVGLSPGAHTVVARFENTPVRSFGNAASLLSIVAVLVWTAAIIRSR